ncbi:MAG: hypothetical protein QOF43_566, partial [Gaiellaceae bacterium]|nr:hypothetical protein [Gaiellaceae bacterium]
DSGFVKCVFPLFAAEPAITATLSREHPDAVPRILNVDSARGLMQMEELPIADVAAADAGPVLRTLAEIQRAWAGRADELLALGAQDRRRELPKAPLPDTLVHGDFHGGNATLRRGDAVIFDWSDACIAQPLFDLHLFLCFVDAESERGRLVEAYAEGWSGVASVDEIHAALELAAPYSCLHQAESYRAITAAVEPDDRWWFGGEEQIWRERADQARGNAARPG